VLRVSSDRIRGIGGVREVREMGPSPAKEYKNNAKLFHYRPGQARRLRLPEFWTM
jgi:hypothetical protein